MRVPALEMAPEAFFDPSESVVTAFWYVCDSSTLDFHPVSFSSTFLYLCTCICVCVRERDIYHPYNILSTTVLGDITYTHEREKVYTH